MHDLIIRNATVVDGTGAPARAGDVAITGGRIDTVTAPGASLPARRAPPEEIDAGGLVAAPGFIDVHTHYDCQLFWDPTASPSSWHGVTSVVMGNCGFTIAPCLPEHRETVMELLLYVEACRSRRCAGHQVELGGSPTLDGARAPGHRPERRGLRRHVGGALPRHGQRPRSSVPRRPTRSRACRTSCGTRCAGAVGWSTSLSPTHFFGDGTPAPTRSSDDAELDAMAAVLREFGHGLIELAPQSLLGGPDDKLAELDLFTRLARIAGKTVTFAPLHESPFFPGAAQKILNASRARAAEGASVVPQVGCRPLELRFDFAKPAFGLENNGFWKPIMHQPIEKRRAMFASEDFRAKLRGFDIT